VKFQIEATGHRPSDGKTPGYTISDGDPVVLAGTTYRVQRMTYDGDVLPENVFLYGPRGGGYFLRGFLGDDNGLRQVISWKSGAPLRVAGNEIRVVDVAGVLEQYVPAKVRR
jgi:hypothetical protein